MHMVIDANAEAVEAAHGGAAKAAGTKCVAIKTLINENPGCLSFKIGQSVFVAVS
jgi:hypothetical protein